MDASCSLNFEYVLSLDYHYTCNFVLNQVVQSDVQQINLATVMNLGGAHDCTDIGGWI